MLVIGGRKASGMLIDARLITLCFAVAGVVLNSIVAFFLLIGIVVGKKYYSSAFFGFLQSICDTVACLSLIYGHNQPSFDSPPTFLSNVRCGATYGKALFWVLFSFRVGLTVMNAAFYFKKLVLANYRVNGHTVFHFQVGIVAFATQALLAGIVHGMQGGHPITLNACSDSLYLEDKYGKFTGFMKLAVLVHIVSFFTFPVVAIKYFYDCITLGLSTSGGIMDRAAFSEFKKLYYLDCGCFFTFALPHTVGLFLYHFTTGFNFEPASVNYGTTFNFLLFYLSFYPWMSMRITRKFCRPFGSIILGKENPANPTVEGEADERVEEIDDVAEEELTEIAVPKKEKNKKK